MLSAIGVLLLAVGIAIAWAVLQGDDPVTMFRETFT